MIYWLLVSMICLSHVGDACTVRQPEVSIWESAEACQSAARLVVDDLYSFCVQVEEVQFW